jgi:hypothetical protein
MAACPDGEQITKQYWVPFHVRACVTATGAVLLDLQRNRYYAVGPNEVSSLSALALNWSAVSTHSNTSREPLPVAEATRIADGLVREGLLSVESQPDDPPFKPVSIDMHAVLTAGGYDAPHRVSLRPHHITRFLRACLWARRAVRSARLYTIARDLSQAKEQAHSTNDVQRAIELVAVFRRLRPYRFAAREQCLFHALALVKFLSHYDTFPTWVIAVRSRPWGAHSWVQIGDLVLDANPEEISSFTPILAI